MTVYGNAWLTEVAFEVAFVPMLVTTSNNDHWVRQQLHP